MKDRVAVLMQTPSFRRFLIVLFVLLYAELSWTLCWALNSIGKQVVSYDEFMLSYNNPDTSYILNGFSVSLMVPGYADDGYMILKQTPETTFSFSPVDTLRYQIWLFSESHMSLFHLPDPSGQNYFKSTLPGAAAPT